MSHSACASDQMGRLRLMNLVFFHLWDQFPLINDLRDRSRTVWRAASSIVIVSLISSTFALLLGWHGSLGAILFNTLAGLVFAALISIIGSVSFGPQSGVSGAIPFGLTFTISLVVAGLAHGKGFPLAYCLLIATAAGFGSGLASIVNPGLVSGLTFGSAFTVMVAITSTIERSEWFAWPGAIITIALATFLSFWGVLIVSNWLCSFLGRRLTVHTARMHWWLNMVAVTIVSVMTGYLVSFLLAEPYPKALHPSMFAVLLVASYYRLPLWPLEAIWAAFAWSRIQKAKDPESTLKAIDLAYFDGNMLLPLPKESSALRQLAVLNSDMAVDESIRLAVHTNHLIAGVASLQHFGSIDPLRVYMRIHEISISPETTRRLLHYVKSGLSPTAAPAWRAIASIFREDYPSTPFADIGALRASLNTLEQAVADLRMSRNLDPQLPHVEPMHAIYSSLLALVKCQGLDQLAGYRKPTLSSSLVVYLPDRLDAILADLVDLASTIRSYDQASSPITQRNALLRANTELELITQKLGSVPAPISGVLMLGVLRWRQLIIDAGGRLANEGIGTAFPNPYVAPGPVSGELFVGREDLLRRLEGLWAEEGPSPSVILYGHRRMGKSSILHNLGTRFGEHTVIVDFNLQLIGPVRSSGELLYDLALALYDRLSEENDERMAEPVEEQFLSHSPYTALNRYLDHVDRIRHGRRFIIAIDEFEIIEAGIKDGLLEPELLAYWRGLIQTHSWIIIAFAGLHTLQEMTQDYWNPLFSSVTAIPVSYLSQAAARRLITRPTNDFSLDYDSEAVDLIIRLTNGQPYLVQHLCRSLVGRLNHLLFEEGVERCRRLTLDDVQDIIDSPEYYSDASAYFAGVWQQAEEAQPPGQAQILTAMARSEAGMSAEDIAQNTGLSLTQTEFALRTLKRHDVIDSHQGYWRFSAELMRLWLLRQKSQIVL